MSGPIRPLEWGADEGPSILLVPSTAAEHTPSVHPAFDHAVTCSCGAAMYASSRAELSHLWRRHLMMETGPVGEDQ